MKAPAAQKTPLILTPWDEEILKALHTFRYMTAKDVAYHLLKPQSAPYCRRLLMRLAGGDFHTRTYVYSFPLPKVGLGRPEKVFTLGAKGRDFLAREAGLPVDWYFRPEKIRHLSFSHLMHALLQTRVAVAAQYWSRQQATYTLTHARLSYELARDFDLNIIPDAWLVFERTDGDTFPILLEIDRGMEYQQKFKAHVKARIEFVRSGQYAKLFGMQAVMIAYVTTGQTPEYRESRCKAMCQWTQAVLEELGLKNWAGLFRFHSVVLETMYEQSMFAKPVWRGLESSTPVMLFPA